MTTLAEKIAAARAAQTNTEASELPVEIGGELVTIGFKPLPGSMWTELVVANPPRGLAAFDNNVGYNVDATVREYPVEFVTVDGESVDEDTWGELVDTLASPSRKNLSYLAWGLNDYEPRKRLQELLDQRSTATN